MTNLEAYEVLRDDEAGKHWSELGYANVDEYNVAFEEAWQMALKALQEAGEDSREENRQAHPKGKWIRRSIVENVYPHEETEIIQGPICNVGQRALVTDMRFMNYCPNCGARLESEE